MDTLQAEPTAPPRSRPAGATDGRRLRAIDSRRRIIAAMRKLILAGDPAPPAETIAATASVGLRTVFRLFRDIESICAEMLVPERQEFVACFTEKFVAPRGAARTRELFDRLVPLYEARMPIRRAATMRRYSSPSLAAVIRELDLTIAAFIRHQHEGDIAGGLPVDLLIMLMSYDAWMHLRDGRGLSHEQTVATLQRGIDMVLPPA